ncbi:nitronate monooxygenase [Schaalia sp. ZJ1691]|uniref:NAD(P)H-dependent flavin oxidoreductase n=1 Tax=Schaalia sp. ZJ1691 TaxID=2709404 RepID=UPI0013EB67E3|nr:nitronate monooxygenase [Schaalia sp. ZJ1691]
MHTHSLFHSDLPLIAAPMAGGISTVALARATAEAGAFPFLAAGYKTPQALDDEITQMRQLGVSFGVNLFVPSSVPVDRAKVEKYRDQLREDAEDLGISLAFPSGSGDDHWSEKLRMLIENPVPVVSLTFGLPDAHSIKALQTAGSTVVATVTTVDEAQSAEELGVDGLIVQGPRAGGHSATFDVSRPIHDCSTRDLVLAITSRTTLPVVATGGVDGPFMVRDLLDAGAQSVAVGTLLLRADEAGTSQTYRDAVGDAQFTETVLTRAFTGRLARSLRNSFIDRHRDAPSEFPTLSELTLPIRKEAAKRHDAHRLSLWAGTGWRSARAEPTKNIIDWLASEL